MTKKPRDRDSDSTNVQLRREADPGSAIYPSKDATELVSLTFSAGSDEIHGVFGTPRGRAALCSFVYFELCRFRDLLDNRVGVPFQLAADWDIGIGEHGHNNPEVIVAIQELIDRLPWIDRAIGLVLQDTGLREDVPDAVDCPYGTLIMGCLSDRLLKSLHQSAGDAFREYSETGGLLAGQASTDGVPVCPIGVETQARRDSLFVTRERVAEVRGLTDSAFRKRIERKNEEWPDQVSWQPDSSKQQRTGWFLCDISGHPKLDSKKLQALSENPGYPLQGPAR